MNIFEAGMNDDVTAKSDAMAKSIEGLAAEVKTLGDEWISQQKKLTTVSVTYKQAKQIFKDSGENLKLFAVALKMTGISSLDAAILTRKMTAELKDHRLAAMGMKGLYNKIFNPKAIWLASHALNVLSKGFSGVHYAASKFYDLTIGKAEDLLNTVVEAGKLREDTMLALKDSMKGTEAQKEANAQELYHFVAKAATITPLDTDYLIAQTKQLVMQGWDTGEAKTLLSMVADIQTEYKGETGQIVTTALARMKSLGVVTNRDFRSLLSAFPRVGEIYQALGKKLGIKETDEAKIAQAVKKKIQHGEVSAYTMVNAMIARQEEQHGGGLGKFAVENSRTLSGAINNAKNAFQDLMKIGDVTKWTGLRTLADFLVRVTHLVTDEKGAGGRLMKGVESFANGVLGGLSKITDGDIEMAIDSISKALEWAGEKAGEIWDWIGKIRENGQTFDEMFKDVWASAKDSVVELGHTIGEALLAGMVFAVPKIVRMVDFAVGNSLGLGNVFDKYKAPNELRKQQEYDKFMGYNQHPLVEGVKPTGFGGGYGHHFDKTNEAVVKGVESNLPALEEAGAMMSMGLDKGVVEHSEQHSPSKLMERRGKMLVEGFVQGVDIDKANTLMSNLPPLEGEVIPRTGGHQSPVSIDLTVPIQVVGGNNSADDIGRSIIRLGVREALTVWERLAKEG